MSAKRKPYSLTIVTAAVILGWFLFSCEAGAQGGGRWIVELEEPSLVEAVRIGALTGGRDETGRIDPDSVNSRSYLEHLADAHEAVEAQLGALSKGARVERTFSVLLNALVVSGAAGDMLREIPGVLRVFPADTREYLPTLDNSLDYMNVEPMWHALGGEQSAGEGIKIAVIDSGIDIQNPLFDPSSFTMPPGYPLGETGLSSAKVIVARSYFRVSDGVDPEKDSADAMDHMGHGSHCAGIAAGVNGTVFDLRSNPVEVSGVAPRAYLMNYKVFYRALSGTEGAQDPELMAAFEDAVTDGADVISCSWGGPASMVDDSPASSLYQAAVDAGVVVVFAAGNNGDGPGTVTHPGTLPKVLTVGSVDAGRRFAGVVTVESPTPVPTDLQEIPALRGSISPGFEGVQVGPLPIISARTAGQGINNDGCNTFPFGVFMDSIALIERGNCFFKTKIDNAQLAGAHGVVIFNNVEGASPITMGGDDVLIPAVQVGNEDGLALEQFVFENPGASGAVIDTMEPYLRPESYELIAGSSGRGPTDAPLAKPEMTAVGVRVLSADAHWLDSGGEDWGLKSGTSMATPHVAGAAALVRQRYPQLDAQQVKALLVSSTRGFPSSQDADDSGLYIWDIGAGVMDLGLLTDDTPYAIPPVLSMGEGRLEDAFTASLSLSSPAGDFDKVEVRWRHDRRLGIESPTVSPKDGEEVELKDGTMEISILPPPSVGYGELTGALILEAETGGEVEVPYYYRVVPPISRDVLILDLSFLMPDQKVLEDMYKDMVDDSGYSRLVYRMWDDTAPPTAVQLSRFETVLVITGNDLTFHETDAVEETMDALSMYAARGGNIIVAGQGAFRENEHKRFHGFVGARTADAFPLIDPSTLDLVVLDDYLVHPVDGAPALVDSPMDLSLEAGGMGNLTIVGYLDVIVGSGLPQVFSRPFLEMRGDPFPGGSSSVGMLFDPYLGYGFFPEMETVNHRAVVMGFGFERVPPDGTEETAGRGELFEGIMDWVTERIDLNIQAEAIGKNLILDLDSFGSPIASANIDFGDGNTVEVDGPVDVYHEYEQFGTYQVTVVGRAPLGAADVVRGVMEMYPEEIPSEPVDDYEDVLVPEIPQRSRDCACGVVGSGGQGRGLGLVALLGVLALFLVRMRHG